jgi:hypothetical protein
MSRILLLPLLCCLSVTGWAQAARSPFLPPAVEAASEAQAEVVEDAELQFCGIFGDGDEKRFLIYNVTTRRSSWLKLDEEGPDELFVQHYDPDQSTVNVRQGGRALTLALQGARIAGGGSSAAAAPVALTGNAQQDLVNTVKVNPTPADERRRLEAVAAEVRRRRAARAAAAAGNNNSR